VQVFEHHQLRVAGEDCSVSLAPPWPRRTIPLHRSVGNSQILAEQDLAICSLGDQDDVSRCHWKTAKRCIDLTTEGQTSWNVVSRRAMWPKTAVRTLWALLMQRKSSLWLTQIRILHRRKNLLTYFSLAVVHNEEVVSFLGCIECGLLRWTILGICQFVCQMASLCKTAERIEVLFVAKTLGAEGTLWRIGSRGVRFDSAFTILVIVVI